MARPNKHGLSHAESVQWPLRLPTSLLAAWKARVDRAQADVPEDARQSPQEALRAVMRTLVSDAPRHPGMGASFEVPTPRPVDRGQIDMRPRVRREIRLTPNENEVLEQIAASQEASVQSWLVSLIRAALTGGVTVGGAELKALSDSNYQLMVLSRTLNELAAYRNADPETRRFGLNDTQIERLSAAIEEHRATVQAVIHACSHRWMIG